MKPLLNSKTVCEILGISPAVLSRMVHSNRIPYVLLSGGKTKLTVRFREDELEKWLDRRSRGAVSKSRTSLSDVDKKNEEISQPIETKDKALFLETGVNGPNRAKINRTDDTEVK
jgi:excisionase family DNA binding protein